jgi:hypothetical protein
MEMVSEALSAVRMCCMLVKRKHALFNIGHLEAMLMQ